MTFWNRLLVVVEKDLYVALLNAEEQTGTPRSVLCREAIREYVNRHGSNGEQGSKPKPGGSTTPTMSKPNKQGPTPIARNGPWSPTRDPHIPNAPQGD